MRKWTVAVAMAALAVLASLPANADHRHHGGWHARPHVSFGYSYGYPYYGGYYRPWYGYGPYWGSSIGVGVRVDPYRSSRSRTQRSSGGEQKALKMYVYPAAGQSEAQTSEDRYQCHVWASDQSGYDPTQGAGDRDDAQSYTRAFTACMEGRNYVVK
jgi:hypothetical protein